MILTGAWPGCGPEIPALDDQGTRGHPDRISDVVYLVEATETVCRSVVYLAEAVDPRATRGHLDATTGHLEVS
jgi:hypothetical protein